LGSGRHFREKSCVHSQAKKQGPGVRRWTLIALLLVLDLLSFTNLQVQIPSRRMLSGTIVNSKNESLAGLRAASR
jgi:hypothetical protein